MTSIVHAIRSALELALTPLDRLPAALSLALVAALTGLLMLVAVRWVSPQSLIQRARDRMAASIYEMRIFLDEPRAVVRAQGRLIGWMAVYLAGLLPAILVLTVPLGLLYLHLETRHGLAPLDVPATVVMRVGLGPGIDGHAVDIEGTDAVTVTAPILFAADEPAAYARLQVARAGTHRVLVRAGGETIAKQIAAGPDGSPVAPQRQGGIAYLWSLGAEAPPDGDAVRSLSLRYPERPQRWLGLPMPWWLYWLVVATVVALLLRRRFGVVF